MFTSDNGPQLGGQGEMSTARHNCGFNGAKGNVFEGGIRVPMVIRWLGSLRPGKSLDEVVHFTDWVPTLAEAAGLEIPDHIELDGESILPLLQGEGEGPGIPRFWQWNRYTPVGESNAAMRDGQWKLVRPRIMETMVVAEDLEMDRALKYKPDRFADIVRADEPERTIPEPASPELYNTGSRPIGERGSGQGRACQTLPYAFQVRELVRGGRDGTVARFRLAEIEPMVLQKGDP